MHCKNRPLCSACCSSLPFSGCMDGGILRLLSPQGTSPNSFSVNFHPLPNSDEPFLPPTPQWRICPRSLCPPLISFFDCSLSADTMQRMQIHTLSFVEPLPWINAVLNEATLAHIYSGEGAWKHAHITISRFACSLWHSTSNTFKMRRHKCMCYLTSFFSICLYLYSLSKQLDKRKGKTRSVEIKFNKRYLCVQVHQVL